METHLSQAEIVKHVCLDCNEWALVLNVLIEQLPGQVLGLKCLLLDRAKHAHLDNKLYLLCVSKQCNF